MPASLARFFRANFEKHRNECAYRQRRGYRTESFTYGEVLSLAQGFAASLEERGISKGDRAMIWCVHCAESSSFPWMMELQRISQCESSTKLARRCSLLRELICRNVLEIKPWPRVLIWRTLRRLWQLLRHRQMLRLRRKTYCRSCLPRERLPIPRASSSRTAMSSRISLHSSARCRDT